MIKTTLSAAMLCTSLLAGAAFATQADPALLNAVNSDFRQSTNMLRDQYRHPAETLAFFDITPSQTVIELWPGGGWYAEILAPYLAKEGHYIAANFQTAPKEDTPSSKYFADAGKKFEAWLADNKSVVGNATTVTLEPPTTVTLGEDGSADLVLTFRNLHNWAMKGQLESVFVASYNVLKEGGIFGVVEHRANPGMDPKSGYMDQAEMITLAEKVGFTLVATSEINANSKDTKDYVKGVWSLPPRLALGEEDKQRYLDIGESDRMTLKFTKKSQ